MHLQPLPSPAKMNPLHFPLLLLSLSTLGVLSVATNPDSGDEPQARAGATPKGPAEHPSFDDGLRSCLMMTSTATSGHQGPLECVSRGAMGLLRAWHDEPCLDFGGVSLERSLGEGRNVLDLDWEPKGLGSVVRTAAKLLERRSMRWSLDGIYPGLQMRVGPSLSAESGQLEFVLDERPGHYHNRQLGTGRLLMRQLVLPFLLGFKFNLASFMPLLFGLLILVTKKALVLTKIALLIAGLLGWNSIFGGDVHGSSGYPGNGAGGYPVNHVYGHPPHHHPGGGLGGNYGPGFLHDSSSYTYDHPYRGLGGGPGFPFGQHVVRELVNVYDAATGHHQEQAPDARRNKNVVWPRDES